MNEVFLIGRIITDIEFKFIVNSKNISIAKFKIVIINGKQIINLKVYDEIADFAYSNLSKNEVVIANGCLNNSGEVVIKKLEKI